MVRVRGIEAILITADSYSELLKAVGSEMKNYEGFEPSMTMVDDKRAIVYHADIVEEPLEAWQTRKCCECGIYEWGNGCPYREGHVTLMMNACHHFTVEMKGDDADEV